VAGESAEAANRTVLLVRMGGGNDVLCGGEHCDIGRDGKRKAVKALRHNEGDWKEFVRGARRTMRLIKES